MGKTKKKKKKNSAEAPPPYSSTEMTAYHNHQFATEADIEAQRRQEKRRKRKVHQKGRRSCVPDEIKAFIAFITIALAVFDIYTDASVLRVFIHKEMSYLTYAMICIVFVSAVIFFLQLYAFYLRIYSICNVGLKNREEEEKDAIKKKRENQYMCCAETSGYLLLVLEDGPASVILVLVTVMPSIDFGNGVDYCELYSALFEESYTGWLSLLASFIVACWKCILSLFYCCSCCCMEWGGIEGFCFRCLCCGFRIFRPIYATLMVGCVFYLFYVYQTGYLIAQIQCPLNVGSNNTFRVSFD